MPRFKDEWVIGTSVESTYNTINVLSWHCRPPCDRKMRKHSTHFHSVNVLPLASSLSLVDRVMFDYVSGGSCACCGFQHFLPNGTSDLVDAISDLDTDQANHEKAALQNHPWPADVRDQVWADRVRLRQKLKKDRSRFAEFWEAHGEGFARWLRQPETVQRLRRWLQLPRTEVMEVIQQKYNIHSAFAVVLCEYLAVVIAIVLRRGAAAASAP